MGQFRDTRRASAPLPKIQTSLLSFLKNTERPSAFTKQDSADSVTSSQNEKNKNFESKPPRVSEPVLNHVEEVWPFQNLKMNSEPLIDPSLNSAHSDLPSTHFSKLVPSPLFADNSESDTPPRKRLRGGISKHLDEEYSDITDSMPTQEQKLMSNQTHTAPVHSLNDFSYYPNNQNSLSAQHVPLVSHSILPDSAPVEDTKFHNIDKKTQYLNLPVAKLHQNFRDYITNFYDYEGISSFPIWIHPEHIRDSNGNKPQDDQYDPSTLWIPQLNHQWAKEYKNHFTPGMQQYWEIKQSCFDKIVLFKMGRFYEIFYIDACVAQPICDLRWMGSDTKPHIGFPEQSLHIYSEKLVNAGLKVVVVEQMETPKQLEERNRLAVGGKDKAVRREICEIFTKGTIIPHNSPMREGKYILSLWSNLLKNKESLLEGIGFCLVDVSLCKGYIGHIFDDTSRLHLSTLITQFTPSEIIFNPKNLSSSLLRFIKRLQMSPELSPLSHSYNSEVELKRYFDMTQDSPLSKVILEYKDNEAVCEALAEICVYLRSVLLDEKVLKQLELFSYNPINTTFMILDSYSLKNLEILRIQNGTDGPSLFTFLNRTTTSFGSRLLRKWITSPLISIDAINERLDCVEWLRNDKQNILQNITKFLKKLPDVEHLLSLVSPNMHQSEKKAVYFDNVLGRKFQNFLLLVNSLEEMQNVITELNYVKTDASPKIFNETLRLSIFGGSFPDMKPVLSKYRNAIIQDEKSFRPQLGLDENYDLLYSRCQEIEKDLHNNLISLKKKFGSDLSFCHSKFRYEIESPDTLSKTLCKSISVTSSRKGYIRFQTESIRTLVEKLEAAEEAMNLAMHPFIQRLYQDFYTNIDMFKAAIYYIAQLDCFTSLALVSRDLRTTCRPKFILNKHPILHLRNCRHPILEEILDNFIPNDVLLGDSQFSTRTILLSGPNMGGKSTILRQVCIAVVMAQIGCFVSADTCEMTPVDRIFTRIGARDSIVEGSSTFLIELQEMGSILSKATPMSLAIVDELGRGTSTFDGTAIACSALKHITEVVKCLCLFSTHFHSLCQEFESHPNVTNYHMAATVNENEKNVAFLFKLTLGACPSSHGLHAAKLAGVPLQVIKNAELKSQQMRSIIDALQARSTAYCLAAKLCQAKSGAEIHKIFNQTNKSALRQLRAQLKIFKNF